MALTVLILGQSGDGKSTSIIVDKDGNLPFEKDTNKYLPDKYGGMNPESTLIVNSDGKILPFPYESIGWKEPDNLLVSTYNRPITADLFLGDIKSNKKGILDNVNSKQSIKSLIIDTMNGSMNDKEMLETRNLSWDKWYDLAKDYYALLVKANSLRKDLIIYLFGHVALRTTIDGEEEKTLLTNGKKLEKIDLATKFPIVLSTAVVGNGGDNTYNFETRKNKSITKTPVGMFKDFLIPNSLRLVDDRIREYYNL